MIKYRTLDMIMNGGRNSQHTHFFHTGSHRLTHSKVVAHKILLSTRVDILHIFPHTCVLRYYRQRGTEYVEGISLYFSGILILATRQSSCCLVSFATPW